MYRITYKRATNLPPKSSHGAIRNGSSTTMICLWDTCGHRSTKWVSYTDGFAALYLDTRCFKDFIALLISVSLTVIASAEIVARDLVETFVKVMTSGFSGIGDGNTNFTESLVPSIPNIWSIPRVSLNIVSVKAVSPLL